MNNNASLFITIDCKQMRTLESQKSNTKSLTVQPVGNPLESQTAFVGYTTSVYLVGYEICIFSTADTPIKTTLFFLPRKAFLIYTALNNINEVRGVLYKHLDESVDFLLELVVPG